MIIKNVLFPTDFSEGAAYALPYALDIAKSYNAKLHLLHVLHDVVISTGMHIPHTSVDLMYKDLEDAAKKSLEKLCLKAAENCKDVQQVVVRGIPYEEILKYAGSASVDLIVIGTHGRKGLDRFMFGSTAERVVRNSACPVMTVRKPD
jgi:nucleotide-binding universal stress UspA family protein